MQLVSLKIRGLTNRMPFSTVEKDIFFASNQLTLIKPNHEDDGISMVKIAGEWFAVNGTPAQVNERVKQL